MRTLFLFTAALLIASAAGAQNQPPQTQPAPASGPLVLERIHNGWVLAPDFKVTDIDNRTGELAGAYGGRVYDNTLLVGGAGYWLTNEARDFKMAYGGVIVGWQSREFGRIRFGGRGLAGGGSATLGFDVAPGRGFVTGAGIGDPRGGIRFGVTNPAVGARAPQPAPQFQVRPSRVIARDDFAVFEPTASVSARITRMIGVSCGAGYRETVGADILRDRINGPTANLAIQFGW